MSNMKLIEAKTVGAGGIATIEFTSIPQTYTDLVVKLSVRGANSQEAGDFLLSLNGSTSNFTMRRLFTAGATVYSDTGDGNFNKVGQFPANSQTANTFSNAEIYITNYASANTKVISGDTVSTTNGVLGLLFIGQVVWSNSAAITSLTLSSNGGNFIENSTAYLYGIQNASIDAKATGGIIYQDNDYFYHAFPSSSIFAPTQSITADVLMIAGGGSGSVGKTGTFYGSGGGAGQVVAYTSQNLTATNYTVTIGGGGSPIAGNTLNTNGNAGTSTQFTGLTSATGGGGGLFNTGAGGTSGNGFAGGSTSFVPCGGGGGAGAVGGNATSNALGGAGGVGLNTYSSWLAPLEIGEFVSGTYYVGGGGSGSFPTQSTGAAGGGGFGTGSSLAGKNQTGGGGAGGNFDQVASGAGGSGIVIVRYAK